RKDPPAIPGRVFHSRLRLPETPLVIDPRPPVDRHPYSMVSRPGTASGPFVDLFTHPGAEPGQLTEPISDHQARASGGKAGDRAIVDVSERHDSPDVLASDAVGQVKRGMVRYFDA